MEAAEVLPEAKKVSHREYVVVAEDATGAVELYDAATWRDVKKVSNSLPEGRQVIEVLRVTNRIKPKFKTVVQF